MSLPWRAVRPTRPASAPGCEVFESAQGAASAAQLTFITVPDGAIEPVTRQIQWRAGQFVVHCSGATEVAVLHAAAEQGAEIGGFHPLQLFADPRVALPLMAGSSVAIEAQGALDAELRRLAAGVGYRPITLPPGVRPRCYAATNYAASFLLSMLREACDLWNSFGVDDAHALAALLPLARGTLDTAAVKGLPGALAAPSRVVMRRSSQCTCARNNSTGISSSSTAVSRYASFAWHGRRTTWTPRPSRVWRRPCPQSLPNLAESCACDARRVHFVRVVSAIRGHVTHVAAASVVGARRSSVPDTAPKLRLKLGVRTNGPSDR